MKYIILLGDGMADYPLRELDNMTPLQAAQTTSMDTIASRGKIGMVQTIPQGLPREVILPTCLSWDMIPITILPEERSMKPSVPVLHWKPQI